MAIITGSNIADILVGTSGVDNVLGLGGNDTLEGLGGADTLNGGGGSDTATYAASGAGVNVFIGFPGFAQGGDATGDTFNSIENIIGSEFGDVIIGNDDANDLRGNGGSDSISGEDGADVLGGDAGNDTLEGGDGNDSMNGGAGADRFSGGADRDLVTYRDSNLVSQIGVTVNLTTGVGTGDDAQGDTFFSIEDLEGTSFADVLTGNGSANSIAGLNGNDDLFGEGGNDTLSGGNGNDDLFGDSGTDLLIGGTGSDTMTGGFAADTMQGGSGNDIYVVDSLTDVVDEAAFSGSGTDTVQTSLTYSLSGANVLGQVENLTLLGTANIDGTGNALANRMTGNAGNNILNGAAGADTMLGLGGNDLYIVDNAGDLVNESAAGSSGIDRIQSSISFDLGSSAVSGAIENLTLSGTENINATGNFRDNVLTGNAGDNLLDGDIGFDTMIGLEGNDRYVVNSGLDVVDERGGNGIDTVESSVSFNLDSSSVFGAVENLTLLSGFAAANGTGNDLGNRIIGNGASNDLEGGRGNDTLTGNGGADDFVFDAALDAATNVDIITDFSVPQDRILLQSAFMSALSFGGLNVSEFRVGNDAGDATDRIIYNAVTGDLFYDADGTGSVDQVLFAQVDRGLAMTNADFFVF